MSSAALELLATISVAIVAVSVGLPGVIAHGMYTLALAARAVADWFPEH